MKVKKLSIGIRSVDEVMGDFVETAKAIERGEHVTPKPAGADGPETCPVAGDQVE